MKIFIIKTLLLAFFIFIICRLIPGIQIDGYQSAIITTFVLALLNAFLKPFLNIISLPITLITLGAFSLIINTVIILLADSLVDGFSVSGFFSAFIFSILLSAIQSIIQFK